MKLVTEFPIEQMRCESPRSLSSSDVELRARVVERLCLVVTSG
jgi:hypothetical protein